ncbi:TAXI family TRAP transporter solute-binding subunit [Thalassospira xiamenensis]|uniref:TRAP ABC transporter substrate-binding protein n=1 Tax=Thalassospira xiamenensis TaxID=220697 RepID=A0A367XDV7_9PROT|nr:TAXI family TRAP transporter solute-binding subunit [Thalassospira xiamenensis]KZB55007.1 TRAP ABC transporter substrate-binding protein [Thalassospira xiamenensis]RCK51828.1 TRAP ABC transporter substrate-binding protein [Thalassospira xiamenensis]
MNILRTIGAIATGIVALSAVSAAQAETRVTFKSAKAASSYYQMAAQFAEAIKTGTDGEIIVTVEESQGSVQNVMEASVRPGNYLFTSPPALVGLAQAGKGAFEGRPTEKFNEVRALFPIPSLTMHFVMRAYAGVTDFAGLEGKTILLGKGSFGATEGEKYLELFGLTDKVKLSEAELSNAVAALKNGQIDGFVTAGSWPAPNVIEAAAGTDVNILSLSDEQLAMTKRDLTVIPAGTYNGQKDDIRTSSLSVVAYATTQMDDETAYQLTKTYWGQKSAMSSNASWWKGVTQEMLANIKGKIHPGALRYYAEAGFPVRDDQN